ncbi:MAG: cardiolipin synthase [Paracoccaceae bacterium]
MNFGTVLTWIEIQLLVQAVVIVRILLREDRDPAVRTAWILVVLSVPILGAVVYLTFGEARIARLARRRMSAAIEGLPKTPPGSAAGPRWTPEVTLAAAVARAEAVNGLLATAGNRVELLPDAPPAIDRLIADIDEAKRHVSLCFYIWLPDETGARIADAVVRAARRGVACRCLADGLGARHYIASPHWDRMGAAGARLAVAFPFRFASLRALRARIDIRNHRKIAIIDGEVAHTGSQNLADPEFRIKAAYAPWVDIMVRVTGPSVWQMQYLFLCDWVTHSGEGEAAELLDHPAPAPAGDGGVAVIGSGPELQPNAVTDIFQAVVAAARESVEITTPYYVPDQALHQAIVAAATRGVRVRMILPARNDSFIVAHASRSFYKSLLSGGVEIFEYQGGFLHAKALVADGRLAVVGSANMDRRSFDLNYENCLLTGDAGLAAALEVRRTAWLARCRAVGLDEVRGWSRVRRIQNNLFVLFAPLL